MWRIAIQIRISALDEAIRLSSAFRHSETRPWKFGLVQHSRESGAHESEMFAGKEVIIGALTLVLCFRKINIQFHVLSCTSMFPHSRQPPASSLLQFLSFKLRGAL